MGKSKGSKTTTGNPKKLKGSKENSKSGKRKEIKHKDESEIENLNNSKSNKSSLVVDDVGSQSNEDDSTKISKETNSDLVNDSLSKQLNFDQSEAQEPEDNSDSEKEKIEKCNQANLLSKIEGIEKVINSSSLDKEIIDELMNLNKKMFEMELPSLLKPNSTEEEKCDEHREKSNDSEESENGLVKEHVQSLVRIIEQGHCVKMPTKRKYINQFCGNIFQTKLFDQNCGKDISSKSNNDDINQSKLQKNSEVADVEALPEKKNDQNDESEIERKFSQFLFKKFNDWKIRIEKYSQLKFYCILRVISEVKNCFKNDKLLNLDHPYCTVEEFINEDIEDTTELNEESINLIKRLISDYCERISSECRAISDNIETVKKINCRESIRWISEQIFNYKGEEKLSSYEKLLDEQSESCTKKKKIMNAMEFNRNSLDYKIINNKVEYSIPEIGKCYLRFKESDKLLIKNKISMLQSSCISEESSKLNTIKCLERNNEGGIPAGFLLRERQYTKQKDINYILSKKKKEETQFKKKHVQKAQEWIMKKVFSIYCKDRITKISKECKTNSIVNYDWNNPESVEKICEDHFKNKKFVKRIPYGRLDLLSHNNKRKHLQTFAETLFGSYAPQYCVIPKTEEETNYLINKINKRYKTIISLYSKPILSYKSSKAYCDSLLNFLLVESKIPKISFNQMYSVNNEDSGEFSKEEILGMPFHSLLILQSTVGRLVAIHEWKRLILHPKIVYQEFFDCVFGFKIKNKADAERILHNESIPITVKSRENKLILLSSVLDQIRSIVRLLKPVMNWRYLMESEMNLLKDNGKLVMKNTCMQEDSLYLILIRLLYYYTCLKYFNFDQDKYLKIQLFCNGHPSKDKKIKYRKCCVCMYGINSKALSECLINGKSRELLVRKNFEKYFTKEALSEEYKLNEEGIKIMNEMGITQEELEDEIVLLEKKLMVKIMR